MTTCNLFLMLMPWPLVTLWLVGMFILLGEFGPRLLGAALASALDLAGSSLPSPHGFAQFKLVNVG